MAQFPIIVINCKDDELRAKAVSSSLRSQALSATWIEAIDARKGMQVFAPYIDLIADVFWCQDKIKPGALACFLSHRMAWQHIVNYKLNAALVLEDDSVVEGNFDAGMGDMRIELARGAELVFVNDRAAKWRAHFDLDETQNSLDDVFRRFGESDTDQNLAELPKALGGDGYVLTLTAANKLLAALQVDKICCGVDWYLIWAGMHTARLKHRDTKFLKELRQLHKMLGPRKALLEARILPNSFVANNGRFKSAIRHKKKVPITRLRGLKIGD